MAWIRTRILGSLDVGTNKKTAPERIRSGAVLLSVMTNCPRGCRSG